MNNAEADARFRAGIARRQKEFDMDAQLAAALYAAPKVSKRPQSENPHPWPFVPPRKRLNTARAAAEDCCRTGLSMYQAGILIADWDRMHVTPASPKELGALLGAVYGAADRRHRQTDGHVWISPKLMDLKKHFSEDVLPRQWLIPGLLPAGQRTAILGRWESGKSWLALDIAMSVAFGTKFLGEIAPSIRGNVVIVDGEGGRSRAIRRFKNLGTGRGLTPEQLSEQPSRQPDGVAGHALPTDPQQVGAGTRNNQTSHPEASAEPDPHDVGEVSPNDQGTNTHLKLARSPHTIYWYSPEDLSLSAEDSADDLSRLLTPVSPVLIVLDTLSKVMGLSDENSNAAASRVTKALYTLNQGLGSALLLLAHPAKSEGGDPTVRGAGELSADLDVLWHIQNTGLTISLPTPSPVNHDIGGTPHHHHAHTSTDEDKNEIAAGPSSPLSGDLRSVGSRRHRLVKIRSVSCEKDRDADLQDVQFGFTVEDTGAGTVLVRQSIANQSTNGVESTILEALDASTNGLNRSEIVEAVEVGCGLHRSTAQAHILRLKKEGKIAETTAGAFSRA